MIFLGLILLAIGVWATYWFAYEFYIRTRPTQRGQDNAEMLVNIALTAGVVFIIWTTIGVLWGVLALLAGVGFLFWAYTHQVALRAASARIQPRPIPRDDLEYVPQGGVPTDKGNYIDMSPMTPANRKLPVTELFRSSNPVEVLVTGFIQRLIDNQERDYFIRMKKLLDSRKDYRVALAQDQESMLHIAKAFVKVYGAGSMTEGLAQKLDTEGLQGLGDRVRHELELQQKDFKIELRRKDYELLKVEKNIEDLQKEQGGEKPSEHWLGQTYDQAKRYIKQRLAEGLAAEDAGDEMKQDIIQQYKGDTEKQQRAFKIVDEIVRTLQTELRDVNATEDEESPF